MLLYSLEKFEAIPAQLAGSAPLSLPYCNFPPFYFCLFWRHQTRGAPRSNLIKGRGMVMQLNYESFDFHDLHCSAMSLSKRSSHCKPRCQTSWNNIFARIGNGVISPIGSKTFEAMLNRLLLVSGSLAVSTLAGTLKMKQSVNVFQQIPSAFSGSLALKSMVLDSACSCSAIWLRTSFELVAHLD